ncbi:unnamed protein product [Phytomonas sp. Hart1]|nr:unnamed protein product [Phytomonas sp. Hart1]|eukprot:CCW69637.1 unnamed protein product [Phytomonas sp. isolate Hart1]
MKYIPLASFETINSLLHAVEAQGCLITIRLEAFTCRHTREERQIAADLAQYQTEVQRTPPLSPSPALMLQSHPSEGSPGLWRSPGLSLDVVGGVPPPLVLGGSVYPDEPPPAVAPEDIDARLVFFVAALNGMYCRDGYDFAVLTERDFVSHDAEMVRAELELTMQGFPESCQPAVRGLWNAIRSQVLDPAQGCEVYEFCCPSCDPLAATSIFSHHYFFYNKTRKVVVVLVEYAEGNRYRGDDGSSPLGEEWGVGDNMDGRFERDLDLDYNCVGKNREFYGY